MNPRREHRGASRIRVAKRTALAGLLAFSTAFLCGSEGLAVTAANAASTHVFLSFLDRPTTFPSSSQDDAPEGTARLAPSDPIAAFPWEAVDVTATSREQVVNDVTLKVAEIFAPYDLSIHLTLPREPTYTTVAIGGDATAAGFPSDLEGLSLIDCGDDNADNVAFAFIGGTASVEEVAIVIAHELGHTFGLEHTSLRSDIMFPERSVERVAFQDEDGSVLPPIECGQPLQNSRANLMRVLGARDPEHPATVERLAEPPSSAGCSLTRKGQASHGEASALMALVYVACVAAFRSSGGRSISSRTRSARSIRAR